MLTTWLRFVVGAVLIIIAGTRLTRSAGVLATAWGLSAGWAGVLLLPLATSLPELVTSVRGVLIAAPDLVAGNLLGSCAFNIAIIALVDLVQGRGALLRRVSEGHILAAALGIMLLSLTAVAVMFKLPVLPVWDGRIGLETILLIGGYLVTVRLLTVYERRNNHHANGDPSDIEQHPGTTTGRALVHFVVAAVVILFAGVVVTDAADLIAIKTGLGPTFIGSTLLAIASSLPEVVTTASAARAGMLDMAVGNILGANVFNLFILGLVSLLHSPGPLLHAVATDHVISALMAIGLTALTIAGLIYRCRRCVGWLGVDSAAILAGYLAALWVLYSGAGL